MSIQDIYKAVVELEDERAPELVRAEIDAGTDPQRILNDGLIAPMDEVGRLYSEGELFVPEMLKAAKAMKAGLEVIRPLLTKAGAQARGTLVIGTVKGDLHDIGKNLVAMMLEGAGFEVIDLGVDVGAEKFLAAAQQHNAQLVCMSALLTTTMPAMEATVRAIRETGLTLKTMVGGAPVTESFARKIGSDGYGPDAPSAVELARKLLAA